jgi:hypothetical protein
MHNASEFIKSIERRANDLNITDQNEVNRFVVGYLESFLDTYRKKSKEVQRIMDWTVDNFSSFTMDYIDTN